MSIVTVFGRGIMGFGRFPTAACGAGRAPSFCEIREKQGEEQPCSRASPSRAGQGERSEGAGGGSRGGGGGRGAERPPLPKNSGRIGWIGIGIEYRDREDRVSLPPVGAPWGGRDARSGRRGSHRL